MYGLHFRLHNWQVKIVSVDDPWCALDNLRCGKNLFTNETSDDRIAYLELFRRLFSGYPAILFLEWLDVVISTQARDPGSVPVLLLASFVSEAIVFNHSSRLCLAVCKRSAIAWISEHLKDSSTARQSPGDF